MAANQMTLSDIKASSRCRIIDAAVGYPEIQSRFYALGLYPGIEVEVLRYAPMGDPIQLKVGHSLLSIRQREAQHIRVEEVG